MEMLDRFVIDPEIFWDATLKLGTAVVLAGMLGLERELRGRAAGLRTHILVCLGSTLAMIVSELLVQQSGGGDSTWRLDAGRIAAGIITGVGFLGAGTIINIRNTQVGLTTAALIWFAATLGVAIGAGYFAIAGVSTILALLVVLCFRFVGYILPSVRRMRMSIRLPKEEADTKKMQQIMKKRGFKVDMSHAVFSVDKEKIEITFDMTTSSRASIEELAGVLQSEFGALDRIYFEG